MKKLFSLTAFFLAVAVMYVATLRFNEAPRLSQSQSEVYADVINWLEEHPDWTTFRMEDDGHLRIKNRSKRIFVDLELFIECCSVEDRVYLSQKNINRAKTIATQFGKVSTNYVQREGDMLLFYNNSVLRSWTSGYVYSMSGRNPNQIAGPYVTGSRPLRAMGNNWYYSKRLAYGPPR